MKTSGKSFLLTLAFFAGLLLLYVGERLVASGTSRWVFSLSGLALVLVAVIARALRVAAVGRARASATEPMAKADLEGRLRVEKAVGALYGLGVVGLVLYGLQSDLMTRLLAQPLDQSSPKLAVALAVLWPVCVFGAVVPLIFAELSYAGMARAPQVESGRVMEATYSGLGLLGALVFAFVAVYVATERDVKWDFSYFRTTRPGEATRKIVEALDAPLEVSLFFPPANEVKEQVFEYVGDLARSSPNFQVKEYDHALDPVKARELGVSGNGALVLSKGGRKEQMVIGLDLERARGQLRNLDKDFQKKLLQVARSKRTVYLVAGHGERSDQKEDALDQRPPLKAFRELLTLQNLEVRNLTAAEGLASEVPKDAGAVFLLGPIRPLLPEESAALVRYVQGGGRLFAALDPEAPLDFADLLSPLGLKYVGTTLANEREFVRRTAQASDHTNIVTASFSSHPSVTTLGQLGARAPVVLLGASAFERADTVPPAARIDVPVRSLPNTFNDLNGNFTYDAPDEKRKAWDLAVAVTWKKDGAAVDAEGRAYFLGDVDGLSDLVLGNVGNAYLGMDAAKWLVGDEALAGTVSSEVDVPIQHTRKQDTVWFYSTIFLAPALVLGVGFWVTRRRRPKARQPPGTLTAATGEGR